MVLCVVHYFLWLVLALIFSVNVISKNTLFSLLTIVKDRWTSLYMIVNLFLGFLNKIGSSSEIYWSLISIISFIEIYWSLINIISFIENEESCFEGLIMCKEIKCLFLTNILAFNFSICRKTKYWCFSFMEQKVL